MSQQASKGTPASGKLSKQLEQQKNTNPHALAKEQDGPSRVVVSTPPSPLLAHLNEKEEKRVLT